MSRAFKILAICPFFLPKLHPEVIVNAKLFLGLLERGHDVDVLTAHDNAKGGYVYSTVEEDWWKPLAQRIRRVEEPARSRWGRFFADALACMGTGCHYRGVGDWKKEFREADRMFRQKKYDCILYRGPGSMGLAAIRAAQKHRVPLIINLSDPWYNFPAPYVKEKNLKFKQRMAARILKHADAVTFPSKELAEYSLREYPVLSQIPCRVVPHIYRDITPDFTPVPEDAKTFTLTHAGAWGLFRNPRRLFQALRQVADRNPDLRFCFNVVGRANPDFERMLDECGLKGIVCDLGQKTYMETSVLLKNSTALVLLEAECDIGIFMPSKFVDYLQAGRPILAISPARGCIAEHMKQFPVGEFADVCSVTAIADALQRMVDKFRSGKLSDYNSSAAAEFFSVKPLQRTEALIAQLVKSVEAENKGK